MGDMRKPPRHGLRITVTMEAPNEEMMQWVLAQGFVFAREQWLGVTVSHKDEPRARVSCRTTRLVVDELEAHRPGIIEAVQTAEARVDEPVSENAALREQLAHAETGLNQVIGELQQWQERWAELKSQLAQAETERDDYHKRLLQVTETEVEI